MRLARPFILFFLRPHVRDVRAACSAIGASCLFYCRPSCGRGSKLSAALLQGACLRPTRSDEKLPELFAIRVLQSLRHPLRRLES